MQYPEIHILNGDALKDQFPPSLKDELIVAKECLVDGNVTARSLDELFEARATYLKESYGSTEEFYRNSVITEFKKIISLPDDSTINLWFEDDLFCQINFWFVSSLIKEFVSPKKVFLVRPHTNLQYGFGGLDSKGLVKAYEMRSELSKQDLTLFSSLWKSYQKNDHQEILKVSKNNAEKFPFLLEAAKANVERFPMDGSLGRPEQTLLNIMKEIGSDKFGPVFQEFHKRESIYGFGDLQVKKIFDQLKT
ncbi:MAG: DUF1835 domain-containing protein [Balneola sp.]